MLIVPKVLEARLEQADLLKKVSNEGDNILLHIINFSRLSMLSRIWSRTAILTAMTPASRSKPWTTPTSPSFL